MSIKYYNTNAEHFFDTTVHVDMSALYERFTDLVPTGSLILDLGCGAGRDSKFFSDSGYRVEAIDGSKKLVEKARQHTGLDIKCADFFSVNEVNKYDAIWACASLLHVPKPDLPRLVHQLIKSMKESGVMYCSFKYGDGEREKDGRTFTDLNEDNLREIVFKAGDCCISDMWMSEDKRPDRAENWLNCLINKT